jgi:hypothetical protein
MTIFPRTYKICMLLQKIIYTYYNNGYDILEDPD